MTQVLDFFSIVPNQLFSQGEERRGVFYLIGERPFSFYLLEAAAVVGTVAAVVSLVLYSWPFALLFLSFSAVSALGAYQINQLVCHREMETNIADFEGQLQGLEKQNGQLKQLLARLKRGIHSHFKQELEGILEMSEKSQELSDVVRKMDQLANKMAAVAQQEEQMMELNQRCVMLLEQFSEQILTMQKLDGEEDRRLQLLHDLLSSWKETVYSFGNEVGAFEKNTSFYLELSDVVTEVGERIQSHLSDLHELKKEIGQLGQLLGSKTADLSSILLEARSFLQALQREKRGSAEETKRSSERTKLVDDLLGNL